MTLAVVILAAGQGTRMQSRKQKILHEVGGLPMVVHSFRTAQAVADLPPVLVVGPDEDGVAALLGDAAVYAVQQRPLGTGDAARAAAPVLRDQTGQIDQIVVTYADMPLLRTETIAQLAATQAETGAAVVLLSVMGEPDSTFGRVLRDANGQVCEILEVAEAKRRPDAAELLAIRELNAGVYCYDADWLWATIGDLPLRQARRGEEYYLTDLVEMAVTQGKTVAAVVLNDPGEGLGAGTRAEMVAVERAFRRRATDYWLDHGVTIVEPEATTIDPDVTIGQDTVIWPGSYLLGRTVVGEACRIGPNATLRDARLGDGCVVEQAIVEQTELLPGTIVEPFSRVVGDLPGESG